MPIQITNKKILDLLKANVKALDSINKSQEKIAKRIEALGKENQKFVDAMNEEYGWGEWNNVDAKTFTFIPREEFAANLYIIQNPAVREKVEAKNIKSYESFVEEEISFDKFKELYPDHAAFNEDAPKDKSFATPIKSN